MPSTMHCAQSCLLLFTDLFTQVSLLAHCHLYGTASRKHKVGQKSGKVAARLLGFPKFLTFQSSESVVGYT